eukprot:8928004-Alexandrium_andersonii.AAC.1
MAPNPLGTSAYSKSTDSSRQSNNLPVNSRVPSPMIASITARPCKSSAGACTTSSACCSTAMSTNSS